MTNLFRSTFRPLLGAATLAAVLAAAALPAHAATVIEVTEDVMTSSFFTGANTVRGYAGEGNRAVLRTSTDGAFGLAGAETIYLTFDYDFSAFSGPVTATLTLQSISGGFGADASADSPFLVSAHAVAANPLTTIIDDTNPGGSVSWLNFFNNYILPAAPEASTSVNGFGAVSFDVSAIVNGWANGTNTVFAIALTGKNDTSGNDFLHGFLNNNNSGPGEGHTFLTVTAVPEPGSYAMLLAGLAAVGGVVRRRRGASR